MELRSGRPGPVVIDLPKDILIGKGPYAEKPVVAHRSYRPQVEPDAAVIKEAVALPPVKNKAVIPDKLLKVKTVLISSLRFHSFIFIFFYGFSLD